MLVEENGAEQATFTYEQAKREMEENAPAFTAKKKGIELPFAVEKEEVRPLKTPFPKGFIPSTQLSQGTSRLVDDIPTLYAKNDSSGAEKLKVQFPDLYYQSPVLTLAEEQQPAEEEDVFAQNKKLLIEQDEKKKQDRIDISSWEYVGKLFNTYLMYQMKDTVYIIDQHAAHERLIFDSLKAQMAARKVCR